MTGDVYEGEFSRGRRHGEGLLVKANGVTFMGTWRKGKPNGIGAEHNANGSNYQGEYVQGVKHGKGLLTFLDGSTLECNFE